MRKKILVAALAAAMTITSTCTVFAADTTSDLIGQFSFDDNVDNAKGGTAEIVGKAFADPTDTEFTFEAGVKGNALRLAKDEDTNGLDLKINPSGEKYTVAVWAKADKFGFAAPIVWIGARNQTTEAWTGLWAGFGADWSKAPEFGSNDSSGARVGAVPETGLAEVAGMTFGWTFLTAVVDNGVATLYYNGEQVAQTADGAAIASAITDDSSVYVGANAWDSPFNGLVDELYVYDRALTAEDVKALYDESVDTVPEEETKDPSETTTKLLPKVDDNDYTKKASKDDNKTDYTWVYIVCGIAAVVVVAGIVVVVVKKGKKAEK